MSLGLVGRGLRISHRQRPAQFPGLLGVLAAIVPALRDHLALYVGPEQGDLLFTGVQGGPMRRSNFNKMSAWPHSVRAIGAEGLHFRGLRRTGNCLAAKSGAGLRDLMARMGHDSERAATIYQHEAQGAKQAITKAIDAHIEAQQHADGDDDNGTAGALAPAGNHSR